MNRIFKGTVINGNKIGRRMGFPTANILIDSNLPVKNGVYKAWVVTDGAKYNSMVNIGVKPTVGSGEKRVLEAHLFDFSGDLYGKEIEVELGEFIRDERRFDSIEELRKQIEKDKTEIIKSFQ